MYISVNDPHLDIINTFQGEKSYSFRNVSLYQEYTDVLTEVSVQDGAGSSHVAGRSCRCCSFMWTNSTPTVKVGHATVFFIKNRTFNAALSGL